MNIDDAARVLTLCASAHDGSCRACANTLLRLATILWPEYTFAFGDEETDESCVLIVTDGDQERRIRW